MISGLLKYLQNAFAPEMAKDCVLPITIDTPINRCAVRDVRNIPTIFYDVDGVLHANHNESLSHSHLLVDLLCSFDVQLVMCSSWRESMDCEYFGSTFHPTIVEKTVGFTPVLNAEEGIRSKEVECFARQYGIDNFVCIDDTANLFDANCQYLCLTQRSTGITQIEIDKIANWLSLISDRAPK